MAVIIAELQEFATASQEKGALSWQIIHIFRIGNVLIFRAMPMQIRKVLVVCFAIARCTLWANGVAARLLIPSKGLRIVLNV